MSRPPTRLVTERLVLRTPRRDDAAFFVELLNDPGFLEHIGDKGVRTAAQAADFVEQRLVAHHEQHGFCLDVVERRADGVPLGIAGLIRRPELSDVDVGYAFLPAGRGQGFAREATTAVLERGRDVFGLERIVAIAKPGNERSCRLLEDLGLVRDGTVDLGDDRGAVLLFVPAPDRHGA